MVMAAAVEERQHCAMHTEPFVDLCLELLSPLGLARARRMFGGHGLYVDERFIAIVAGERLYLKADATTQRQFAAAGCEPFTYAAKERQMIMNYWTVPAEALESPALMAPWARLAMQAALSAAAAKATPKPRRAITSSGARPRR
jgi:DNA transformation protein